MVCVPRLYIEVLKWMKWITRTMQIRFAGCFTKLTYAAKVSFLFVYVCVCVCMSVCM